MYAENVRKAAFHGKSDGGNAPNKRTNPRQHRKIAKNCNQKRHYATSKGFRSVTWTATIGEPEYIYFCVPLTWKLFSRNKTNIILFTISIQNYFSSMKFHIFHKFLRCYCGMCIVLFIQVENCAEKNWNDAQRLNRMNVNGREWSSSEFIVILWRFFWTFFLFQLSFFITHKKLQPSAKIKIYSWNINGPEWKWNCTINCTNVIINNNTFATLARHLKITMLFQTGLPSIGNSLVFHLGPWNAIPMNIRSLAKRTWNILISFPFGSGVYGLKLGWAIIMGCLVLGR